MALNVGKPLGLAPKPGGLSGRPGVARNTPKGISSISQMSSSAHIYTSGDATGVYNSGESVGSRSTGSISSLAGRGKNSPPTNPRLGGGTKPIMPLLK